MAQWTTALSPCSIPVPPLYVHLVSSPNLRWTFFSKYSGFPPASKTGLLRPEGPSGKECLNCRLYVKKGYPFYKNVWFIYLFGVCSGNSQKNLGVPCNTTFPNLMNVNFRSFVIWCRPYVNWSCIWCKRLLIQEKGHVWSSGNVQDS